MFKWNTETDGNEEFDINTALNANWDKVDKHANVSVASVTIAANTTISNGYEVTLPVQYQVRQQFA